MHKIIDVDCYEPYAAILSAMNEQRVVHVMDWIGVCEIDEVDTEHIADAYYQMKSIYDAWEEGEISRAYTVDMHGVELCSDGSLDDGVFFTLNGEEVITVLNGKIISALYEKDNKNFIRIDAQEFDIYDYI